MLIKGKHVADSLNMLSEYTNLVGSIALEISLKLNKQLLSLSYI